MNNITIFDDKTAYSFGQLIEKYRNSYYNAKDISDKENIITNYIIDSQISYEFLQLLISSYASKTQDNITFLETILSYFNILVYSLNLEQVKNIIDIMQKYNLYINNEKYNFLMGNEPIFNFTEIFNVYQNINKKCDKETIINEIDEYIKKMSKIIYDIELDNYYFPPSPEQPNYAYNYFSFKIFKILNNFQKCRTKAKFYVNNKKIKKKYIDYKNITNKWDIYKQIYLFFLDIKSLLDQFINNNIEKNIKILKIITFHLNLFEHSRDYFKTRTELKKTIACLNSNPISNKILDKYKLYRADDNNIITKDNWDKIGINEEIVIKEPFQVNVKIKHFNENILEFDDFDLETILKYPTVDNLNIDGLLNHSLIKFNSKIEEYCKNLLKYIFASDKYINIFKRNDDRFDLNKEEELINEMNDDEITNNKKNAKKIFESIFRGPNKDIIFEEIWSNIFCLPFYEDLSGFNNRSQYTIFLNTVPNFRLKYSSRGIIAQMHNEINTLIHEFSHNIALLMAANIGNNNFETKIIYPDDELKNLQNTYKTIYEYNGDIYNVFSDFGDIIEVELYGIKPNKFKTFSALFCLNKKSYDLDDEKFREICASLYKYNGQLNDEKIIKSIIESKTEVDIMKIINNKKINDIEKILINLFSSEFIKLVLNSFKLEGNIGNYIFDESENARSHNYSLLSNEEYSVNRDYCDKLNEL